MSDWSINLTRGLGQLEFGMSQSDVSTKNAIYGDNPVVKEYGNSAENFVADLGDLAEFFTEEILQGAVSATESFDAETAGRIGELREKPYILNLEYADGQLASVGLRDDCLVLQHNEMLLFGTDAKAVIMHFQKLNGSAKVDGSDILFDKIGLVLTGFYHQGQQGAWRFYRDEDREPSERFVTLFAPQELHRFESEEFVLVDFGEKN